MKLRTWPAATALVILVAVGTGSCSSTETNQAAMGEPETAAASEPSGESAPSEPDDSSAQDPPEDDPEATPESASRPDESVTVDRVVIVSIDGLKSAAYEKLGEEGAPSLYRIEAEGASTLNARSMVGSTSTLPSHTSMLTARTVVGSAGHHLLDNRDIGGTLHDVTGEYVESVFSVVHDHGGSTSFYAAKDKFNLLARSWDEGHGGLDSVGEDNGTNKIDTYVRAQDADSTQLLVEQLADAPATLSFLHLGSPDKTGHGFGWMSEEYLAAVRACDGHVASVIHAIETDARLAETTTLLVTTDHGGTGKGHGDPTRADNYTIPFFAWGAGVAVGADLYELNPDDRIEPGNGQPSNAGPQPIRNADVANLATGLLGLPAVPGSDVNPNQTLDLR